MFRKSKSGTAAIDSLLGAGTRIQGDLQFVGGLHLEGAVAGSVKAHGDGVSRLIVGEAAVVEGSCEAHVVELHGNVKGDVLARERVVMGQSASLESKLHYGTLEMAAGATIKGKLLKL